MKKIIFLLCFIPLLALSRNIKHKNSHQKPQVKEVDTVTQNDTARFKNNEDTLSHVVHLPTGSDVKIIFIKDSDKKSYFFVYIFPIITLILGVALDKFLDYLKERRELKRVGKDWVAEIRGTEAPMKKQIEFLEKLLEIDKQDEYIHPELQVIPALDGEVFKSLDKGSLFKYLQLYKKNAHSDAVKSSNRTHGFVSIIAHLHESLTTKFNDYLSGTSKYIGELNLNLQTFMQAFGRYGIDLETELNGDPSNDHRYKPIMDLIDSHITPHREDGKFNPFELEDEFFVPLSKILADLRFDERTQIMSNAVFGCFNAIRGIKMEKHYWRENLQIVIKRYKEQVNDIEEVVQSIE